MRTFGKLDKSVCSAHPSVPNGLFNPRDTDPIRILLVATSQPSSRVSQWQSVTKQRRLKVLMLHRKTFVLKSVKSLSVTTDTGSLSGIGNKT